MGESSTLQGFEVLEHRYIQILDKLDGRFNSEAMYGAKAFLIAVMFVVCSFALMFGLRDFWKNRDQRPSGLGWRLLYTAFFLFWFSGVCSHFYEKAHFHYQLSKLSPQEISSIRIGRHEFRDPEVVKEVVDALNRSRWFEVNHGGWGDSIPLTLEKRSGGEMVLDVAEYFQKPGAIIGPANAKGLGYSKTEAISVDLPQVLEGNGVKLPHCDTAHDNPCTPEQLNP
jgi:hypothetical protein